jgi:hypothetical protein
MKQPLLLDVERDKTRTRKADITQFKNMVGIWTNSSGGESTRDFPKWMALLLPKDGSGQERYSDHRPYCKSDDPYELIAGYCRILEETERATFGHTEREAIQNLCKDNQIRCDL